MSESAVMLQAMTFDLAEVVKQATKDWKLAHDMLTFADIELGEEFVDQDGLTWEKRSERRAISWIQYEAPEVADFSPTDVVRRK